MHFKIENIRNGVVYMFIHKGKGWRKGKIIDHAFKFDSNNKYSKFYLIFLCSDFQNLQLFPLPLLSFILIILSLISTYFYGWENNTTCNYASPLNIDFYINLQNQNSTNWMIAYWNNVLSGFKSLATLSRGHFHCYFDYNCTF